MYIILIGMFFMRDSMILVLLQLIQKQNIMKANTGSEFTNVHRELIDDCRNYDQKAQFRIYKLYYKAMYNVSLRIVKDTMEAEDIMQEAFLSAFEKIDTYSGSVSFGAWLKKIVQNRSIDYLNKKNLLTYGDIESYNNVEDSIVDQPQEENDHDPRLNKVMNIIKDLPQKYKEVVSLYLLEGYDHEEIGEILSIPSSTSRSNFSRARQKIINVYGEC